MPLLGKKWPVPIMQPMWPFFMAGGIIYYGIWKAQTAMSNSDEYKNHPKNPHKAVTNGNGA